MAWHRRKNKSVAVLGEGMVDSMYHEVGSEKPFVVRNVVHPVVFAVEEETVE